MTKQQYPTITLPSRFSKRQVPSGPVLSEQLCPVQAVSFTS